MNDKIIEKVKEVFYNQHGYAKAKVLREAGINPYYIKELEENGLLIKVKRGIYRWMEYEYHDQFELIEISKTIKGGVICLASALSYYELTTYNPSIYQVAIHRDYSVVLPEYPPIQLFYFSDAYYQLGINQIDLDGHQVLIYDKEKTLCDCIRYRNKIGKDIVIESVKEYMRNKDRNLEKLTNYAKELNVFNFIEKYLEVLV